MPAKQTMIIPSSTPLISLDAVVIDTETTGSNAFTASIIQMGGIQIKNGELNTNQTLEELVNPDKPIDQDATAKHGLTEEHIKYAQSFKNAKEKLDNFIARQIAVGHHIAYDLTVLKRCTQEAGLEWQQPRALCTRLLAKAIEPTLANHSLDTLANWYQIEIEKRHNAYYDAILTAKLFLKLIPLLRELGVRTLAEAEAICHEYDDEAEQIRAAGWDNPIRHAPSHKELVNLEFTKVDHFPYLKLCKSLETSLPPVVSVDMTVESVLIKLLASDINCVLVKPSIQRPNYGILTDRDFLKLVNKDPVTSHKLLLQELKIPDLKTVHEDEFLYRAIGVFSSENIKYLGIVDDEEKVKGFIDLKDLIIKHRSEENILGDKASKALNEEDLGRVWSKVPLVARVLHSNGVQARIISQIISREIYALTNKAAELAEKRMISQGHGKAPCSYCVLVLGAVSRGESLFSTDQSNAIIYDGEWSYDVWFQEFGKYMNEVLDVVGISLSADNIMAKSSEWRRGLQKWRREVQDWISITDPNKLEHKELFFDAVPVYGNLKLGRYLQIETTELASNSPGFLMVLAQNAKNYRLPLSLFGKLKTQKGRVELRLGGLYPLISSTRILSLRYNKPATNTEHRLSNIREHDDIDEKLINDLDKSHKFLLDALLTQQLRDIEVGIAPTNTVDVSSLSNEQTNDIIWALKTIDKLKSIL